MRHFIILVYFVSFLVGSSALLLFLIIYMKNRMRLIKLYNIFMLLYTIYLLIKLFDTYILTIVGYSTPNIYIFSNFFYFIWFIFFIYITPLFFHELISIPFTKVKKIIFACMSIATLVLLIVPFIIKNNTQEILILMKFELQVICASFFMITLFYIIYLLWLNREKIENEINKKILKTILTLCVIFLPGFIADFFSYKIQSEWKILPYGFEFNIFFYLTWNIISIIFVIQYFVTKITVVPSVKIPDNFIKKYSISEKEKEIISLIVKGYSNKQIADNLFVSSQTVKNHVYNIFQKSTVKSRTELIHLVNQFI